jgi:hypothetical protein
MGGMDTGFAEQVIVHKNSVQDDYVASAYEPAKDFVNLRRLPFTTVFQNDILPQAQRIAELNNWHHNYHLKDIRELLASAPPLSSLLRPSSLLLRPSQQPPNKPLLHSPTQML